MKAQAVETGEVIIEAGSRWKHPSGVTVDVEGTGFMKPCMEMFKAEDWIPSVTYRNYSGETPTKLFTRTRESFLEKFKKVSD